MDAFGGRMTWTMAIRAPVFAYAVPGFCLA